MKPSQFKAIVRAFVLLTHQIITYSKTFFIFAPIKLKTTYNMDEFNFNEDLEPMSEFEKMIKSAQEEYDNQSPRERYLDLIKDEEIPDNLFYKEGLDDNENEARHFILSAANEGILSFKNIKDYIEDNPYVRDNPDKFKGYLEKIVKIIGGIDDFINNYGK